MAIRFWWAGLMAIATIATLSVHAVFGQILGYPLAQSRSGAAEIQRYLDAAPIPALQLSIYDGASDRLLFTYRKGDFDPRQTLAVASASKWVTGAVLMAMASDGVLQPTDTTGKWLGWRGTAGTITLQHLLSFTSGLNQRVLCLGDHRSSLERCTNQVYNASRNVQPQRFFDYGGTHMTVAGRIAEVASKKTWDQLFETYLRQPLGLSPDTRYGGGTVANRRILTMATHNPRLDGGLRISTNDYGIFLRMIYNNGKVGDRQVIRPELVALMERSQFSPRTQVRFSPAAGYPYKMEYGLGNWVECPEGRCDRGINSSLGAFGFFPWIDRQKGYYGVLAMEQNRGGLEAAKLILPGRSLIEKLVAQAR
jgi:CubicO group peptidase (beta-lactamase class C family)